MASTDARTTAGEGDDAGPVRIRRLTLEDLPGCLELSRSAHWNQNAADWTLMLKAGQGWGIDRPSPDGRGPAVLAGSIIALPFHDGTAGDFAWLSMVLVLPAFGGQGLATRLLEAAVGWLREQGLAAVLDATPQGLPVYTRIGMAPHWMFRRYRREAVASGPDRAGGDDADGHDADGSEGDDGSNRGGNPGGDGGSSIVRPVSWTDWPWILATDRPAFGARRDAVLRDLFARQPRLARVAFSAKGERVGYVFGRDGREATQIGPLWAADDEAARALLDDVVGRIDGAIHVDLADRHRSLLPALAAAGFVEQRPFTRMTLDRATPPGDPARLVSMAGPELG